MDCALALQTYEATDAASGDRDSTLALRAHTLVTNFFFLSTSSKPGAMKHPPMASFESPALGGQSLSDLQGSTHPFFGSFCRLLEDKECPLHDNKARARGCVPSSKILNLTHVGLPGQGFPSAHDGTSTGQ